MAVVGSLVINVSARTSDFSRGISRSQRGLSDLSVSIRSTQRSLTGLIAKLTAAGAALVGIKKATDLITRGVSLAIDSEQAEVALRTILGSSEKAKQTLAELSAFAARTPFQLP